LKFNISPPVSRFGRKCEVAALTINVLFSEEFCFMAHRALVRAQRAKTAPRAKLTVCIRVGKTLLARALATACSTETQKVAFFMRKGADVLSKWVGESERQLKLLFEQAKLMQPAIIFFDEMDGLAPVRSAKQDQIHSSIVTTLLALMDGLDNRGDLIFFFPHSKWRWTRLANTFNQL
jgi:SpoVK/Ycf46/Vps4 family AAA+-type ATPase